MRKKDHVSHHPKLSTTGMLPRPLFEVFSVHIFRVMVVVTVFFPRLDILIFAQMTSPCLIIRALYSLYSLMSIKCKLNDKILSGAL